MIYKSSSTAHGRPPVICAQRTVDIFGVGAHGVERYISSRAISGPVNSKVVPNVKTANMITLSPTLDSFEIPLLTKAKMLIAQTDNCAYQMASEILQTLKVEAEKMQNISNSCP